MNTAERESIEIDEVALAMEVVRPYIRRMSSPSRRKFCADMATSSAERTDGRKRIPGSLDGELWRSGIRTINQRKGRIE